MPIQGARNMAIAAASHLQGSSPALSSSSPVSLTRKVLNVAGCIVCLPIYWIATVHCRWPVTLDLILTVVLTELTRYVNEGRRMAYYEEFRPPSISEGMDPEKAALELELLTPSSATRLDCMAAVVGWREDPALFTRALESYKTTRGCVFLVVGIDGDEAEDQDMLDVFNLVYPQRSATIHVPEPLGEVAQRVREEQISIRRRRGQRIDQDEVDRITMEHCIQLARSQLSRADIAFGGPDAITQLCIRQRHLHKKGIMFSTYIFSLVIADMLGIEFLWSSDSDTIVAEDSLSRTVDTVAGDPAIGGASSALVVHNGQETAVTKLAETVYWGELYLTRSLPAATATSDCQSGPSTLFRLIALPPILVPWYMQTIFGKRMIINEDRHLTTNLLQRGWGVVFASDVLTSTDTPTTLARWLRQQVRWARATHIESLLQPRIYPMNHPLLFYSMSKREFGPAIALVAVVYYFCTSRQLIAISVPDLLLRCVAAFAYNGLRNPHRLEPTSLKWVVPGMAFYHIPLPAVHVWSMLTLTADGWGTSMRASGERAKKDSTSQAWFEMGFFVAWMGIVAGCFAKWLCEHMIIMDGHRKWSFFTVFSFFVSTFSLQEKAVKLYKAVVSYSSKEWMSFL
ncbi:hyaluronan synthase [Purpureocillium lavendulum]|uniref:Hyaluronan synthase n=1 Tax=Purpureocillium lavendulum TaxID=1247861 RepID=A0AB34FE46_9HYPO|nr:hyaluronan synthase [Purpureocillium lavendulum]